MTRRQAAEPGRQQSQAAEPGNKAAVASLATRLYAAASVQHYNYDTVTSPSRKDGWHIRIVGHAAGAIYIPFAKSQAQRHWAHRARVAERPPL